MATSSITKDFVIRDEATYERFMKLHEASVQRAENLLSEALNILNAINH